MAFIPVADTVRTAIRCQAASKNLVNTMWFRRVGGWDLSGVDDLHAALLQWWEDYIMAQLNQTVTAVDITSYDMTSSSGFVVTTPFAAGVIGANASPPAPLNAAMTVTFRTTVRGRSGRGRNYLGGWGENQLDQRLFVAGTVSAIQSGYSLLPGDIAATGADHVVASLYSGGAPRTAGITYLVTEYDANVVIYSQRKRTHS